MIMQILYILFLHDFFSVDKISMVRTLTFKLILLKNVCIIDSSGVNVAW